MKTHNYNLAYNVAVNYGMFLTTPLSPYRVAVSRVLECGTFARPRQYLKWPVSRSMSLESSVW